MSSQEGYILYANEAWKRVLGYSTEELTSRPFIELIHPEDREETVKVIQALKDGPSSGFENRFLDKWGNWHWFQWSGFFIEEDGIVYGVARDVTQQKKDQLALKELNATLEKKVADRTAALQRSNDELEHFATILSHDLREPLRMITSYGILLARRCRDLLDPTAKEFLDHILGGTKRMNEMTLGLLEVSRVTSGAFQPSPVDCARLLEDVKQDLYLQIKDSRAEILAGPLPTVWGAPQQLRQLLQNLIENAIKFHGPSSPHIDFRATKEGNEWLFSVRDQGLGFDPKLRDRIFQIFQRSDCHSNIQGTGVGLAICRRIVQRHGGRIWADSKPGEGTIFYWTIPENPLPDGEAV